MDNREETLRAEKKARGIKLIKNILIYAFLGIWGLMVLFPFYWMVLTSFKSYASYNGEKIPKFYVTDPTFSNFTDAFSQVPLGKYLLNTFIFTVVTTFVMVIVITLAAFAFSRLEFKGRNLLFTVFLSMMMIPSELIVITNFVTVTNLDMRNTFPGLILPSVMSVFYVYLLRENFA